MVKAPMIPAQRIEKAILLVRARRSCSRDLAVLYGVTTLHLNKQRNATSLASRRFHVPAHQEEKRENSFDGQDTYRVRYAATA